MSTKHTHTLIFGRRVDGCPRCDELMNGAAPRAGWQKDYYALRALNARIDRQPHDCKASNCGPVCTWGEW